MINVFGQGEVRLLRLETATAILALGCLVLSLLLGWQATRGLPVCYGTASVAPGLVVPHEVPEAHVRALSEQVVLVLYNITPATAQAAHERVAPLLHPNLLRTFSVRAELERQLMAAEDLSTQLSIRNTVVRSVRGGHAAQIDAVRRVYAGMRAIRDEDVGATLLFRQVQPSPLNPWGLALVRLEFTKPLSAETD